MLDKCRDRGMSSNAGDQSLGFGNFWTIHLAPAEFSRYGSVCLGEAKRGKRRQGQMRVFKDWACKVGR